MLVTRQVHLFLVSSPKNEGCNLYPVLLHFYSMMDQICVKPHPDTCPQADTANILRLQAEKCKGRCFKYLLLRVHNIKILQYLYFLEENYWNIVQYALK